MASPTLTFRSARLTDVDAVLLLVQSAYRGDESRRGWTTEADLLDGQRTDAEEVRSLIEQKDSQILLAYAADELLGCLWLSGDHGVAHIGMFAVRPNAQARGLGRALLEEAERLARDVYGWNESELSVISLRKELIAWYERRGYSCTGEAQPFPYGDPRFGLPRTNELRFAVMRKPLV